MGRSHTGSVTHALRVTGVVTAAMLLGMAAGIPIAGNPPQSPVTGRIAYVPRTVTKEATANVKQDDLVYMKLPSRESVSFRVSHPLLDSEVSGLEWSPDASRLLFVGRVKSQSAGIDQQSDVWVPWVVDLRTKQLQPITQPADRKCLSADWLPDGRRIVAWVLTGKNPDVAWGEPGVRVEKGGDTRLIVIDLKSRREKTIWQNKAPYRYVRSPAKDEILVHRWGGYYYLISVSHGLKWKTDGSETPEAMAFSPDGQKIAIYAKGKLHTIDRNTKARKLLYKSPCGENGHARSLAWSPNGKWIAFREARNEVKSFDPPVVNASWVLLAVNRDTTEVHEFPNDAYKQGEFVYEPTILGWTKDSLDLALSVPEDTGKPYPESIRDRLVLCPVAGGKGVPVADITSRMVGVAWLPR